MGQEAIGIGTVVIFGTMGMMILAMGIIVFFFTYQRKMVAKQNEMNVQALEYQKMLMDAVIQTRELEQRRIALELHDDVGSTLTAIKFSIPQLTIVASEKELLLNNLNNAIQKVRRISNDLLPSILEELGLRTAIRSLVKTLNDTTKVSFILESNPVGNFRHSKEVELAFYRVLQELLNNILKYAEATKVEVIVSADVNSLRMVVLDNGKGFVPADHLDKETPSLGLKNMESRVQQIKAELRFEKLTISGTKVSVVWKK